jgi:hypothetical protein
MVEMVEMAYYSVVQGIGCSQTSRCRIRAYSLSRVHCIPSAYFEERNQILKLSEVADGVQAAVVLRRLGKPAFAVVLGKNAKQDSVSSGWADCINLRQETAAETFITDDSVSELTKVMTEDQLIGSLTDPKRKKYFGEFRNSKWWLDQYNKIEISIIETDSYQGYFWNRVLFEFS